jgi:hypothetical protein
VKTIIGLLVYSLYDHRDSVDTHLNVFTLKVLEKADDVTLGGMEAAETQFKLLDEAAKITNAVLKKRLRSATFIAAIQAFEDWACQPRLVFR